MNMYEVVSPSFSANAILGYAHVRGDGQEYSGLVMLHTQLTQSVNVQLISTIGRTF